jgi:hypothetical protein
MFKIHFTLALVSALFPASLAAASLELIVPSTDLGNTERGAFTTDGRFFVIGVKPADVDALQGTLVEVVRGPENGFALQDYVVGTLEGTSDGRVGGTPVGDPCVFGGMASHGALLYASCFALDGRTSLVEVDTATRTVRAGYFTACNFEPSSSPCEYSTLYPNGMAIDDAGRIYASNTLSHVDLTGILPSISDQGSNTLIQIVLDPSSSDATHLAFRYHEWFSADILSESFVPNGVQIEGQQLYYAAGPNINKLQIRADGTAGEAEVYFQGAALTYIDDFAESSGELTLARSISAGIVSVKPSAWGGVPVVTDLIPMSFDTAPSSVTRVPANNALFGSHTFVITSYFGGGLYVL